MHRLNASNMSLYPVDAQGLAVSSKDSRNIDAMKGMAGKTGGRAFYNGNDMSELVNAAILDSRDGYVVTYAPTAFNDRKPRRRIKITTTRENVRLRYRRTYDASGKAAP